MSAMSALAPELHRSMGLTDFEYDLILKLMGRTPTLTELGMFAVMWSEHCGYKFSRPVLSYFKQYKEAIEGEGLENAGIIDIGDGLGITMKIESHNHPSAVEPHQGAATGVGGIIRDIFTMGARPIALGNSLRFGPIEPGSQPDSVVARNQFLMKHVVEGIAHYGNCVGVPTVAGEVNFHPRYSGNPLVNAMCVGMVQLDSIATAGAGGLGNPVIYLGSATGKDGIHGATFASDALDDDNEASRPNVQIGDPFAEKLLIEATLEALQTGAIHSIQDMGAAGLTCSTIEMSSKGGVGMKVNLDLVPAREREMSAYELMLSESQERMLAVAHRGREQEVIQVFQKWGVHAVVIGEVTEGPNVEVYREGKLEASLDATWLTDHCPTYTTPVEIPAYHQEAQNFDLSAVPESGIEALPVLLSSPNIASKRWIFKQYDTQVQTQTLVLPGAGDAAVLAPRGTQKGIAFKIDGNGRQIYLDPYVGGQLAVAEAARNVACVGARPRAITDGLNYGSPKNPWVYWQFERSVKGIAEAAEALGTPVISGNVSFYNESELGEILPTPLIGMVGVLENADDRLGLAPRADAGSLWLISYDLADHAHAGLGASEYLSRIHDIESGLPVPPDLAKERDLHAFLVNCAGGGLLDAAHDIAEGGLLVCVAEMALRGNVGVEVSLESGVFSGLKRRDSRYFGEFPGWIVVAVEPIREESVRQEAARCGLTVTSIGKFDRKSVDFQVDGIRLNLEDLAHAYESAIPDHCGD